MQILQINRYRVNLDDQQSVSLPYFLNKTVIVKLVRRVFIPVMIFSRRRERRFRLYVNSLNNRKTVTLSHMI